MSQLSCLFCGFIGFTRQRCHGPWTRSETEAETERKARWGPCALQGERITLHIYRVYSSPMSAILCNKIDELRLLIRTNIDFSLYFCFVFYGIVADRIYTGLCCTADRLSAVTCGPRPDPLTQSKRRRDLFLYKPWLVQRRESDFTILFSWPGIFFHHLQTILLSPRIHFFYPGRSLHPTASWRARGSASTRWSDTRSGEKEREHLFPCYCHWGL